MAAVDTDLQCRQLIERLPVAVLLMDGATVVRFANEPLARLLGIDTAANLNGKRLAELLVPEERHELSSCMQSTLSGTERCHRELTLLRPDGDHRHVLADVSRSELAGEVVALVVLRDVTALRLSERRFQLSQRFAQIGTWDWNIATGDLFWSESVPVIFGYRSGELETTYENFLKAVHPDDRQRVKEGVARCLEEGEDYVLEHRVVWPDGSVRWVLERGDAIRDGAGKPLRLLGIVQDITERKLAQEQQELAAAVLDNTPEGVIITDREMRIVSINPAFSRTTGYSLEEVEGKTPAILSSGRHGKAFYDAMWRAISETGQWQGEIWNRRKNGDIYPEWLNISAIRNSAGEVIHYAGIFSDLSTQEHVRERLHNLAYYDGLTQLPNRELFRDRLLNAMARCRRSGGSVGLMFLDIDRFKTVNDSLGHTAGDDLLKAVGKRLRSALRETDTVARLGGDEFAIVLADVEEPEDMAHVASEILDALSHPLVVDGHELVVTCSIGLSMYPADGDDMEQLTKNADTAMYRAKELGRNNYQFYTEGMSTRSSERLILESELRKSIERGELTLVYQPQADVRSGRLIGVEALVRWNNRQLGRVGPDKFIPVAEEMGFIGELGSWVLRESLRQLSDWRKMGFTELRMAVNVSGHQLGLSDLSEEVLEALSTFEVPASRLELELTESVLMANAEATVAILAALHGLGVTLAVDDFGTGYSSLAYLKHFDLDKLKIDKSFVSEIPQNSNDTEIAATIIAMGQKLGLRVVAEGVETEEQLRFLAEMGCDEIQGYFFSPPVAPDEIVRLLEAGKGIGSASG